MGNIKLPHWAQLLVSLISCVLGWLVAQNTSGALVLPAYAVATLPWVSLVLGWMSSSVSAKVNAKAALGAAAKVASAALLAMVLVACTQAQAQVVTNAVFTADQAACLAANSGLIGTSTAAQDFEATCKIAPALDQAVQSFIVDWSNASAAHKLGCR